MKRTALALTACLALVGCAGSQETDDAAASPATSSSAAAGTTTATATVTAQPEDAAGKGNCISAGLAYAPIASALDGATDLESAVQYFSPADIDPATSQAGKDAAVAIAETNFELSLANADVLTGQPVDAETLRTLLGAVDDACAPVLSQ